MSKKAKRKEDALVEIERLKAKRRLDIIKCAAALVVIVVLIFGKSWLEFNGILETGNIAVGAMMMVSAVGLAIFAGSASVDFTKCGHLIDEVRMKSGLSKEEIKAYEKGN